jgi:hypothetical protein
MSDHVAHVYGRLCRLAMLLAVAALSAPRIVEVPAPVDRWDDDGGAQHAPRKWGDRRGPQPWLSRQQRRHHAREMAKRTAR